MRQNRDILAEYPMRSELSSSPICSVYRSFAPDNGEEVVVKIIAPQAGEHDAANRDRFLKSVDAAKALGLPGFPRLLDFGFTEGDGAFMVMEWVAGIGIGGLTGCSPTRTIPLLIQVIDALRSLAGVQVFHHNLSPSDILVVESGTAETVKIVGFGTAAYHPKIKRASVNGRAPRGASFLPPEYRKLIDVPETGAATDIYSIALIATELFGCEVYGAGVQKPVVLLPETLRGSLEAPRNIEEILARALRMDAEERPTYAQLEDALREFLEGTDEASEVAEPASPPPSGVDVQLGDTVILELSVGSASGEVTTSTEPVADPPPPAAPGPAPEPPPPPPAGSDGQPPIPPPIPPLLDAQIGDAAHPVPPPVPRQPTFHAEVTTGSAHASEHDPNKTNPALRLEELGLPALVRPPGTEAPRHPLAAAVMNRRLLLVAAATVASVAVISVLLAGLKAVRDRTEATPPPTPLVARATPIPTPVAEPEEPPLHPRLEQADQLLVEGELEAAKEMVATISGDEVAAFSAFERSIYDEIVNAAESSRIETAIADLEGGLDIGSIRMIKRGVAGLERADEAEWDDRPGLRATLEDARNIIRLHGELWDAHNAGNHSQVLERARAMIAALPKYSTPYDFRNQAAAALEGAAVQLAARARYGDALAELAPIQQYWPERPGLDERITGIEAAMSSFTSQEAAIAAAAARGTAGEPERGLAELAALTPIPVLQGRYDEVRQQLQAELAAIDAAAPVITLAPDCELSFKKKEAALLVFVVSDDHRVSKVSAHLKTAAASSFSELDLGPAGDGDRYQLNVPPETHAGEDFVLYLEAADTSGHTARLGSPEQPLEVKRKGFLKSIFTK